MSLSALQCKCERALNQCPMHTIQLGPVN